MKDLRISKEQASQIAYDCFDAIIEGIKIMEEKQQECVGTDETTCKTA